MMRRKLFLESLPPKPDTRSAREIAIHNVMNKKRKKSPVTLNKVWADEPKKKA
jgi:hypothetical protein